MIFQNRTIKCSVCGRLDMYTSKCVADMKDVAECNGWRVCRVENDCELRGLCPDCAEAIRCRRPC